VTQPTAGEIAFARTVHLDPNAVAAARVVLNAIADLPWPEDARIALLARLAHEVRADVGPTLSRLALLAAPLASFDRLIAIIGLAEKRVSGLVRALYAVDPAQFTRDTVSLREALERVTQLQSENVALRTELDHLRVQLDRGVAHVAHPAHADAVPGGEDGGEVRADTEVRRLAERSQTAAKEIGDLAMSSVKVAERSGRLLSNLVPDIRKTTDLVHEVAATSNEQATGVQQMSQAMGQVGNVTQRNAAAAEELASTAREMAAQAAALDSLMAFFRLSEEAMSVTGLSVAAERARASSGSQEVPLNRRLAANGGSVRPRPSDHGFGQF